MLGPVTVTTLTGVVCYLWLTAVTLPIVSGMRATLRARGGSGWRGGLPIALGIAALTAAIPAAGLILSAIAAPARIAYVVDTTALAAGIVAGVAVWSARAAAFGVPRLPADVEIAFALAVVALRSDDPATLSSVERSYGQHVLGAPLRPVYAVAKWHAV